MSKSYKKTPTIKYGGKGNKRFANKKVRKYKGQIQNGKSYKKLYQSWDINDIVSYYPEELMIKNYNSTKKMIENQSDPYWKSYDFESLEESINRWKRWYFRK